MRVSDFSVCHRVLSSRWMLPILQSIKTPSRFGAIQDANPGLSRGVLSAQLQELREMELVYQTKYSCFPPRVEYTLTEKGAALMEILSLLPKI